VIAHTAAARAFGATDDEIGETIALAGFTRQWSTFMQGMQVDLNRHRSDVDKLVRNMSRAAHR
jgi:alkylhydroperoxidase/carboxymuconolactone decarboxylase family protein YurZ